MIIIKVSLEAGYQKYCFVLYFICNLVWHSTELASLKRFTLCAKFSHIYQYIFMFDRMILVVWRVDTQYAVSSPMPIQKSRLKRKKKTSFQRVHCDRVYFLLNGFLADSKRTTYKLCPDIKNEMWLEEESRWAFRDSCIIQCSYTLHYTFIVIIASSSVLFFIHLKKNLHIHF